MGSSYFNTSTWLTTETAGTAEALCASAAALQQQIAWELFSALHTDVVEPDDFRLQLVSNLVSVL